MSEQVDRRTLLKSAAVSAVGLASTGFGNSPDSRLKLSDPKEFSFEKLKAGARDIAKGAYTPPERPAPSIVQKINYQEWGRIKYDTDHALFADGPGRFPITFFHLGLFFQK
jgi:glucans biosynthesis protein